MSDEPTPARVEAIFIAGERGAPRARVERATAVAGMGLEGDRYFGQKRKGRGKYDPERQVTLVDADALEQARRASGVDLAPQGARRNLVTRGVPLNELVGRELRVGGAVLRGVELCPPCVRLKRLTYAAVMEHLEDRGGLRAEVVQGGEIRVGDPVEWEG